MGDIKDPVFLVDVPLVLNQDEAQKAAEVVRQRAAQNALARDAVEKLVAWLAKMVRELPPSRSLDSKAYLGDDAYVGGYHRHEAMTWAEVKAIVDAARGAGESKKGGGV